VTLSGKGTDADGSIAAYKWSYVSGPTQYLINTPAQYQTTISNLTQGSYVFRVTVTDNLGATGSADVTITVNGGSVPAPTPTPIPSLYTLLPAKIEAEKWSAMSGVQTETTTDAGGGLDVDYIDPADWMDYAVNAPAAGSYTIQLRLASPAANAQLQIKKSDGTVLATVKVPNTGGYQTWQTVSATVTLPLGQQTLRIVSTSPQWNPWNINWLNIVSVTVVTPVPVSTTFRVEAENWSAMSGVQTETTTDVGGGKDVDYIDPADWMDYAVNAPSAGSYNIQFRVASPAANAQLQLKKSDGTVLATVNVPNTGGWETWQTVSATVTLPAGQQTLRIVSTSPQWNSWNINYMDFTTTTALTSISAATAADGSSFSVSPNPVVDKFILQVNNSLTGNMDVQILDGAGAVKKQFTVLKSAAGSTQTYLSISDLAAGSYTIQVTMTGWKATQPLVKQ
ncbi:MAG TPA: carbohydrate-binding protein, partial [Flavisolibacter sp.]|nr:carbohydrate-binding protein [Flavisolibacter sp.]